MCRFVLFVVSLAFVAPPSTADKTYRPDYVYNKKTDAFYKLHTEALGQSETSRVCEVEGATLMQVTTQHDVAQVHGMLKQFPDIGDQVWIANDDQQHESAEEPAIIDLEPTTERYTGGYWNKQCDVMTREGKIETMRCGSALPFVCKVAAKNTHYDSVCGVYGIGYVKGQNVSSCYKIPNIPYTWNQAYAECQAEGAHLVVLNSQIEHDAVYNLMSTAPKLRGANNWWFFFAGFRADVPTDGSPKVFKTIFNETLEEAGYSTWADNEPNNYKNNENCGALFKNDGKLNDIVCTDLHGFICEKEITSK